MSWMRVLFALLLPLCGDGSYNNYRLSMLAEEPFVVDCEGDDDEDGSEDITKWEWHFHAAIASYASMQVSITGASFPEKFILLTLLSFQSLDQFVSEDNLIFSADFAEMRDI